jgi:hypothetical protein
MADLQMPLIPLVERMTQAQHRAFALACAEWMLPLYAAEYPDHFELTRGLALLKVGRVPREEMPRFTRLLEAGWRRAFHAEATGSRVAPAAFLIVNCLELELMAGSLIRPVLAISHNTAHAWVWAQTGYRRSHPGYAAAYLDCLQRQRTLAEKLLRV